MQPTDAERDILKVEDLSKSYGNLKAIDKLNFQIAPGECLAILGPNGAGKTTTCEILEGLITADSGRVEICGLNYSKNRQKILEQIGVQLQETQLYKKFSVCETLDLFASFYPKCIDRTELIQKLDLKDFYHKRLEALSGGQKQRVYLACALLNRPKLIFLDEPTAGLDPKARHMIWDIIADIRKQGCAILLTSHYLEEAEKLADNIAILNKGKIVAQGSAQELIKKHCQNKILDFNIENLNEEKEHKLKEKLQWFQHTKKSGKNYIQQSKEAVQEFQQLTHACQELDCQLSSVSLRTSSLEDVFLKITEGNTNNA